MASKARPALLPAILIVLLSLLAPVPGAQARPGAVTGPPIDNPVSQSFADTYADPAVIEGKDGWWYAYATSDPLRAGDPPGLMHVARTRDFQEWDYRGTVFTESNRPAWATATSGLWAPDIRYLDGRYLLYFTVTDTTLNPGDDSAIGVAEAPSPEGPWTPSAEPVVAPRAGNGGFLWTFDPAALTDVRGRRYLYFGSYNGGVWVTRLSDDGLRATGEVRLVAVDNKFEGAYVVRHGRWYYLMASSANCCAGPATGYSVFAGRSRSPLGPFRDADGISLTGSRAGGMIVVTQNGNRWIGAGHNAVLTDHAGRDFLVYHALDRTQPWLSEPFGINRRPMLIDRLDWVDGWPRVRAGAGPSDGPQPGPVTGSDLGITPADPVSGFLGLQDGPDDDQAGETARVNGPARSRSSLAERSFRLRLDVSGQRPVTVALGTRAAGLRVTVDPAAGQLVVRGSHGRGWVEREPIRLDSTGWRTLVVEATASGVLVQFGEDDPQAEVRHAVRGRVAARAPIRLNGRGPLVDNVSVRPLATGARRLVPQPTTGRLLSGDEFSGGLAPGWEWVRENPDVEVADGRLAWPLEAADLTGTGNDAGVLLREPPSGNYVAETKLTLDLGTGDVRNFQQAGLVAYASDDDFARLSSVAIWNTRQTEYGRELAAVPGGEEPIYGGAIVGTPAPTVWLRLAHTLSAAGEHRFRAGTSRDGRHWTWGAVWTFPAGAEPRIGLVAHGGDTPPALATFDYLRFHAYRSR